MMTSLAFRFLRKYKFYFILGVLIFGIQVFLAYKSLRLPDSFISGNSGESPIDQQKSSNIGVEKKSPYFVNTTSLGFQPPCTLLSKDAISALNRAKTVQCKKLITEVACHIQSNRFYPSVLTSDCPKDNIPATNKTLGCYRDEKDFRLLAGYFMNFKTSNSPKKCITLCLQSGFPLAGVQYGTECFCGTNQPSDDHKISDESCDMKCSGDQNEFCGGFFKMNVYSTGIIKFAPKPAELISKPEVSKVNIVFLLTLNGRALRQVHRLIKSLYKAEHFFYIHIDSRQDFLYRELLKLESHFPNIRLARTRFSTIWGGASLLTMLMQCMRDLYDLRDQWNWDFIINLSESDYPIKKVEKLQDFLTANHGMNFVKSHGRETQRFIQKQGLDKTFVECDIHMWRIGDRTLPEGIQVDGGSDWVALSKNFVEFILDIEGNNELIQGLLIIFRHTLLPAESFFHTVLRNSKFCGTYIDNNLHITNWKRKLGCKCQYKHVVDWCGCSPNDFKPEDWPRLEGSEPKMLFFARKFEPIINQEVLNKLDHWIFGENISLQQNFNNYWQSVYHHEDKSPVPDSAALTIAHSILRSIKQQINLIDLKLEEIINFKSNDEYKGFLLTFTSKNERFQTKIRPIQYPKVAKNSKFSKRLRSFEVSTEFDLKEQISRNMPKFIGPNSDPVLSFKFLGKKESSSHSYNLTVLWINPANQLQDYNEIHVEDSVDDTINYSKSSLKHPLTPGIWTVKLIGRTNLYAQTKFLVSPLSCESFDKPIKNSKAIQINSGSQFEDLTYPPEWEQYLASKEDSKAIISSIENNGKRLGEDLLKWIDQVVSKFYTIIETCSVSGTHLKKICNLTDWSSFAPDPKSDIYTLK